MTTTDAGGDDRTAFDSLPPEEMVRVNQWCDKFEQLWRVAEPSLPTFIASIDVVDSPPMRSVLCLELIAIDIQHRHLRLLECSAEHYRLLFPHLDRRELDRVFAEVFSGPNDNASSQLRPNQQLGDYVIKERIGSGGMGVVYRGEHRLMGRQVAIKVLSGRSANDRTSQRRFLREVRSFAKLSHPNIISAFDARLEGELLYLVTEWVQGEDLAQKVARGGPLSVQDAMEYSRQAALGLHYAHTQGIIHRDVKPGNLLLDPQGAIKVLDLGLSRWILEEDEGSAESLTKSMHLLGTAAYMSPEQARSPLASNQQSDVYSLGCTLYFLLTGTPPYTGANAVDILFSHARDPVPDVRSSRESVDVRTADLIRSMLDKEPSQRPPTMADVAQQLAGLLDHAIDASDVESAIAIERPQSSIRYRRSIGKYALRNDVLGGVLFAAIVFLIVMLDRPSTERLFAALGVAPAPTVDANLGITMNGQSSYGQIVGFDIPLPDSALIEASITPYHGSGPANLVTWTGDRIFGLFVDQQYRWGVSLADGVDSYVEVSSEKAVLGQQQVIGARYNGRTVELFIDGRKVQTSRTAYSMVANETTLYFGGLPHGSLPLDQGTRFLAGKLHRLRISTRGLPTPVANTRDLLEMPESTLALIQFSETNGSHAADESSHGWRVRLVDMPAPQTVP